MIDASAKPRDDSRSFWRWGFAALAIMTVLPIGIHTVMLDNLGIPYPASLPRAGWAIFPDHALLLFGLIGLDAYLRRDPSQSTARRGMFLFLAVGAINQALLRLPLMRNVVSTKWTIYPFIDNLPAVLWFAVAVMLVIGVGALTTTAVRRLGAAALIAVLLDRLVSPAIDAAFAGIIAANSHREGDQLYNVPYDWHVDLPSYLTYVEPAIGALATAMVLRRLRVSPLAIAGVVFALQGGPFVRVLLNIWYAPLKAGTAVLSEGQFTFEAIALSVLAATFATLMIKTK